MPAMRLGRSADILDAQGLPPRDLYDLPESAQRFPDGGQYRVEIPSVEGPEAFHVVLEEARRQLLAVHRISQGSGVWLLSDAELDEMAELGRANSIATVLFTGPRASWDTGVQATTRSGAVGAGSVRGADQLAFSVEDVLRAIRHGINGVLVADLGLLSVLGRMRHAGDLPADFTLKVSISLPVANPATARVLEDLGATSLNLPTDLSLPAIAAIRSAVAIPIDMYIESADDFGGVVRHYEVCDLVRIAAPVYLKYTVRNAPGTYPSGQHLSSAVRDLTAERVRRAALGLAAPVYAGSSPVSQPATLAGDLLILSATSSHKPSTHTAHLVEGVRRCRRSSLITWTRFTRAA
jgi:hypothetical protein